MKPASKASLRQRVRWRVGLPVLVSVAVHALVLGLAGVYVVREVTAARFGRGKGDRRRREDRGEEDHGGTRGGEHDTGLRMRLAIGGIVARHYRRGNRRTCRRG